MDLTFRIRRPQEQEPITTPSFHRWEQPDGALWAEFFRCSDGYRLRFPELADFMVSTDGDRIDAYPTPAADAATIEHLYFNQVIPLVLSHRGDLVLHGSAVDLGGEAIAFIGSSGRGKSTLAASFARRGYPFLADDSLRLTWEGESILVQPSHPSIRLWEDSFAALMPDEGSVSVAPALSYTTKARLLGGGAIPFCAAPKPLRRVYILGDGTAEQLTIKRLSANETTQALLKNSILLEVEDNQVLRRHFDQVTRLIGEGICFELDYQREFDMLARVHARLLMDGRYLKERW